MIRLQPENRVELEEYRLTLPASSREEAFYENLDILLTLIDHEQATEGVRQIGMDLRESIAILQLYRYLASQNADRPDYREAISRELGRLPALLAKLLAKLGWFRSDAITPQLPLSAWLDLSLHALKGYNRAA